MSFFKKLFSSSDSDPKPAAKAETTPESEVERFDAEFVATVPRYISTPGATVDIRMRNRETHEVMPFAEAFPEEFEDWKNVQSRADRRGIIYSALDDTISQKLKLWQIMDRYTDDRYPQKALEFSAGAESDDMDSADYWSALARMNIVLARYEKAESSAQKALQIDPSHKRAKIALADSYHYNGKQEEAHAIYNEILKLKLDDKPMTPSITDLLGFDSDILHSPVYAASWLRNDKEANEDTWNWASDEFYFSPQFRSQHAFAQIESGEHMKGFVKLLTLSREMPWFRDAVVNAYNLIGQLGIDSMEEDKARLKGIMEANNWTDKDMHSYTV